jgi:hypothetical protein
VLLSEAYQIIMKMLIVAIDLNGEVGFFYSADGRLRPVEIIVNFYNLQAWYYKSPQLCKLYFLNSSQAGIVCSV